MKKLTMLFLCFLLFGMAQAQNNVKITLNNGTVVEGVTKHLFMLDDGDAVFLKGTKNGEKSEYKSTEIKSVDYLDSDSKEWTTFVPLMAQRTLPSVWSKNPKPYKNPVFLSPVYEGKHRLHPLHHYRYQHQDRAPAGHQLHVLFQGAQRGCGQELLHGQHDRDQDVVEDCFQTLSRNEGHHS